MDLRHVINYLMKCEHQGYIGCKNHINACGFGVIEETPILTGDNKSKNTVIIEGLFDKEIRDLSDFCGGVRNLDDITGIILKPKIIEPLNHIYNMYKIEDFISKLIDYDNNGYNKIRILDSVHYQNMICYHDSYYNSGEVITFSKQYQFNIWRLIAYHPQSENLADYYKDLIMKKEDYIRSNLERND